MRTEYIEKIDQKLKQYFAEKQKVFPIQLYDAAEYAVFSDGKRVRPYLMLLSADFNNISHETVLPLACALELIHTYSLIHDDLPCMDNDDFRRGRPSCHKAFGEAMALLCGDALLNLAYEILLNAVKDNPELAESAAYIAKCASGEGMIGGQAIEFSFDTFDEASVVELCMKKTGALICAALVTPCFLSYDRAKYNALTTYASALGLLFQLSDDLLDADKQESKSYLGVMGEEATVLMTIKLTEIAKHALQTMQEEAKELSAFADFVRDRKK